MSFATTSCPWSSLRPPGDRRQRSQRLMVLDESSGLLGQRISPAWRRSRRSPTCSKRRSSRSACSTRLRGPDLRRDLGEDNARREHLDREAYLPKRTSAPSSAGGYHHLYPLERRAPTSISKRYDDSLVVKYRHRRRAAGSYGAPSPRAPLHIPPVSRS